MGAVKIDIYQKGRILDTLFPMETPEGVKTLLENIHAVREARYLEANYDACVLLIDFAKTLMKAPLTDQQRTIVYWVFERGHDQLTVAQWLAVDESTVSREIERVCNLVAIEYLVETVGDDYNE